MLSMFPWLGPVPVMVPHHYFEIFPCIKKIVIIDPDWTILNVVSYKTQKKSKNNTKFKLAIPHSLAKGVDVLVQGIDKTNSLYNHVIHSIDIEFHIGFSIAVPKGQLGLLQVYAIQDMWLNYNWKKHYFISINKYLSD